MTSKTFKKTVSLAFGMFALLWAGCSSDNDDNSPKLTSNDMIVTLEELEDGGDGIAITRSYLSRDMKTHIWTEDDEMRVYEDRMFYYDLYKFNWKDDSHLTGVFSRFNDPSNVETAAWAVTPNRDMDGGSWDLDNTTFKPYLTVRFNIGVSSDQYSFSTATKPGSSDVYFYDMLPRWGQVTATNDGHVLQTNLRFLTGVLRLQLANTQGHADLLKIQMLKNGTKAVNIKGIFTAKVSEDGEMLPDASLTSASNTARFNATDMLVDLTGATGSIILYLPLVTTDVPVDIVVSASNDNGETWTEFKRFKNKTVTRGKVYGNATEYVFSD